VEGRELRRIKVVLLLAALALSVSFGFSQSFALKFSGGLSYASGGDMAKGIKGETDYLGADYDINGEFRVPYLGPTFGVEIIYYFGPRFGLGLGVGYFRHAKESTVSYQAGVVGIQETLRPKYAAIPITANLHYLLALGPGLRLDVAAGAGYYLTTLDWEHRMDMEVMGVKGYIDYTFKSSKGTFGFQGGIGLEVEITPKLALAWTVSGRYASASELKGDWTDTANGDLYGYSESGNNHYPWYFDLKYGGKTYAQVIFDSDKPSGPNFSDVRSAKLGLTGLATTLGIKINF
jgi:hypothetical protein